MKKNLSLPSYIAIGLLSFFLLLNSLCYSQKAENFNRDDMKGILQSSITQVLLTGNNELDNKIKSAFETYWTVSKFKFVTKVAPNTKNLFRYADMLVDGLDVTFSKIDLSVTIRANETYIMIEVPFDNMANQKKGEFYGMDNSSDIILSKITYYIMLINTQLKKQIEIGNGAYAKYKGETDNINSKTILVQQEYFKNGIDSTLLKELPYKFKILKSSEIISLLETQKDNSGYAQLMLTSSPMQIAAFIIDLKTGDLLNYSRIEKEASKKALDDKSFNKLIKMLKGKNK